MAKQRNSLGICVLPVPDDEMTWEQYKEKYGVDLDKIIEVINSGDEENPDYSIFFKGDFRKLIAVSYGLSTIVPCVSFPSGILVGSGTSPSSAVTTIRCYDADENGGYNINIVGNRTIYGGEL